MDERQTKIREGAGLDASRLNTEFVDFLKKWSTPFLLVLVVIAGLYTLSQRREIAREARIDQAFASLNAATSPSALLDIANEYDNVGAVAETARLRAADTLMLAVFRGLKPGAAITPAGQIENPDDVTTDEDIENFLTQSEGLYQQVWDETPVEPIKVWHKIGAGFGMAAVAETRGDAEAARAWYEKVLAVCDEGDAPDLKTITEERLATLDERIVAPVLLSVDDLPAAPTNSLLSPGGAMAPTGPIGPNLDPLGLQEAVEGAPVDDDGVQRLNLPNIELNVPITPSPCDPMSEPMSEPAPDPVADPASDPAPSEPASNDPGR